METSKTFIQQDASAESGQWQTSLVVVSSAGNILMQNQKRSNSDPGISSQQFSSNSTLHQSCHSSPQLWRSNSNRTYFENQQTQYQLQEQKEQSSMKQGDTKDQQKQQSTGTLSSLVQGSNQVEIKQQTSDLTKMDESYSLKKKEVNKVEYSSPGVSSSRWRADSQAGGVTETSSPLKNLKLTEKIKSHSAASSLDLADEEIGNMAITILEKSARTVGEIKFLQKCIAGLPLFRKHEGLLEKGQTSHLFSSIKHVRYEKHHTLFNFGEFGYHYYIVLKGFVYCLIPHNQFKEQLIAKQKKLEQIQHKIKRALAKSKTPGFMLGIRKAALLAERERQAQSPALNTENSIESRNNKALYLTLPSMDILKRNPQPNKQIDNKFSNSQQQLTIANFIREEEEGDEIDVKQETEDMESDKTNCRIDGINSLLIQKNTSKNKVTKTSNAALQLVSLSQNDNNISNLVNDISSTPPQQLASKVSFQFLSRGISQKPVLPLLKSDGIISTRPFLSKNSSIVGGSKNVSFVAAIPAEPNGVNKQASIRCIEDPQQTRESHIKKARAKTQLLIGGTSGINGTLLNIGEQSGEIDNAKEFLTKKFPEFFLVKEFTPGESFGEIALMTKERRTATMVCGEETHLMLLSKDGYDKIIGSFQQQVTREKIQFLKQFAFLESLPTSQLMSLLHYFKIKTFPVKHILYNEGDQVDDVFFIRSGEVEVQKSITSDQDDKISSSRLLKREQEGQQQQTQIPLKKQRRVNGVVSLKLLGANQCFGEQEVVDDLMFRTTKVIVSQAAEIYQISKEYIMASLKSQKGLNILHSQTQAKQNWREEREQFIIERQAENEERTLEHRVQIDKQNRQLQDFRDLHLRKTLLQSKMASCTSQLKLSQNSLVCNINNSSNGTSLMDISSKDRQAQSLDKLKSLPTQVSGHKLSSLSTACNRDTNSPQKIKQYKYNDIVKEDLNQSTNSSSNSNIFNSKINSTNGFTGSPNENSALISDFEPTLQLSPIQNSSLHPFGANKSASKDSQQQYPVLPNLSLFDFKAQRPDEQFSSRIRCAEIQELTSRSKAANFSVLKKNKNQVDSNLSFANMLKDAVKRSIDRESPKKPTEKEAHKHQAQLECANNNSNDSSHMSIRNYKMFNKMLIAVPSQFSQKLLQSQQSQQQSCMTRHCIWPDQRLNHNTQQQSSQVFTNNKDKDCKSKMVQCTVESGFHNIQSQVSPSLFAFDSSGHQGIVSISKSTTTDMILQKTICNMEQQSGNNYSRHITEFTRQFRESNGGTFVAAKNIKFHKRAASSPQAELSQINLSMLSQLQQQPESNQQDLEKYKKTNVVQNKTSTGFRTAFNTPSTRNHQRQFSDSCAFSNRLVNISNQSQQSFFLSSFFKVPHNNNNTKQLQQHSSMQLNCTNVPAQNIHISRGRNNNSIIDHTDSDNKTSSNKLSLHNSNIIINLNNNKSMNFNQIDQSSSDNTILKINHNETILKVSPFGKSIKAFLTNNKGSNILTTQSGSAVSYGSPSKRQDSHQLRIKNIQLQKFSLSKRFQSIKLEAKVSSRQLEANQKEHQQENEALSAGSQSSNNQSQQNVKIPSTSAYSYYLPQIEQPIEVDNDQKISITRFKIPASKRGNSSNKHKILAKETILEPNSSNTFTDSIKMESKQQPA